MSARDDYPGLAWRDAVTPTDADPSDIGMESRRALAEIDNLRGDVSKLLTMLAAAGVEWQSDNVTGKVEARP